MTHCAIICHYFSLTLIGLTDLSPLSSVISLHVRSTSIETELMCCVQSLFIHVNKSQFRAGFDVSQKNLIRTDYLSEEQVLEKLIMTIGNKN